MKNVPVHGDSSLGSLVVETYNAELRDSEGFIGDRASNRAFREIVDELRDRLKQVGEDPLGDTPTADLSRRKLDKLLWEGDPEAAGVVHGAIEEFAAEFCAVIRRFLKLKGWRDARTIVIGGGLRASRIGELVIGRTSVLLKSAGHNIDLLPIHHDPDHAGLVGAVHLAPPWVFEGHEGILAVDIGGSNLRVGIVELNLKKKKDFSRCVVQELTLWRYADETEQPTREQAVDHIGQMLRRLIRHADGKLKLAPFVGLACPGLIAADGHIERGGQNLPGNWESSRFNLPERIREMVPRIGEHDTMIVMHNDAVVQGLSELPFMQERHRGSGDDTASTGRGKDVKDGKDGKDGNDGKDAKDAKETKDVRDTRDAKTTKADREAKDSREAKDPKEAQTSDGVFHWGVMTIGTGLGNAAFTSRLTGGKVDDDRS